MEVFPGLGDLLSPENVAETLRAEAARLRIKTEGDTYSLENDKEIAFNDLVVIWDR